MTDYTTWHLQRNTTGNTVVVRKKYTSNIRIVLVWKIVHQGEIELEGAGGGEPVVLFDLSSFRNNDKGK